MCVCVYVCVCVRACVHTHMIYLFMMMTFRGLSRHQRHVFVCYFLKAKREEEGFELVPASREKCFNIGQYVFQSY